MGPRPPVDLRVVDVRLRHLRRRGHAVSHLLAEPEQCPLHGGNQRVVTGAVDPLRDYGFPHPERLLLPVALRDQLPSSLEDDRFSGNAVETGDADRGAPGGAAARKDGRSPGGHRDLLGPEAIAQGRDQRAGDLAVERAPPSGSAGTCEGPVVSHPATEFDAVRMPRLLTAIRSLHHRRLLRELATAPSMPVAPPY